MSTESQDLQRFGEGSNQAAPTERKPAKDERAAFEAWAKMEGYRIQRAPDPFEYDMGSTACVWKAWQARANLPLPQGDGTIKESLTVAAKVDAERYRLLRRGQHWSVIDGGGDALRADALDSAIDKVAARLTPGGQP